MKNISDYQNKNPELIICCGDTITHLASEDEIGQFIKSIGTSLISKGKLILSFRDYSSELNDTMRFIPVKSDSERILTCFLEYFDKKVRVTDLLYERKENKWVQKVSSYNKVRVSKDMILAMLNKNGFSILLAETINRMITIIAQKRN